MNTKAERLYKTLKENGEQYRKVFLFGNYNLDLELGKRLIDSFLEYTIEKDSLLGVFMIANDNFILIFKNKLPIFKINFKQETSNKIQFEIIKEKRVVRKITNKTRYFVLKRQNWRCNFCNSPLKFNKNSTWDGEIAHIDHIHPFSERWTYKLGIEKINESDNLQGLCKDCNLNKSNKNIN